MSRVGWVSLSIPFFSQTLVNLDDIMACCWTPESLDTVSQQSWYSDMDGWVTVNQSGDGLVFAAPAHDDETVNYFLGDVGEVLTRLAHGIVDVSHHGRVARFSYLRSYQHELSVTSIPVIFYVVPDYYLTYILNSSIPTGPVYSYNFRSINVDWSQDALNTAIPAWLRANEPILQEWLKWRDNPDFTNIPVNQRPDLGEDSRISDDIDIHVYTIPFTGINWGGVATHTQTFLLTNMFHLSTLRLLVSQERDAPNLNNFATPIVFLPRSDWLLQTVGGGDYDYHSRAQNAGRVNEARTSNDGESIVGFQNRFYKNDEDFRFRIAINDEDYYYSPRNAQRTSYLFTRMRVFKPVQEWSPPDDFAGRL